MKAFIEKKVFNPELSGEIVWLELNTIYGDEIIGKHLIEAVGYDYIKFRNNQLQLFKYYINEIVNLTIKELRIANDPEES